MGYKTNTILRFLIILSLLTGSVAAASTPYPIFGKITLDGSPAHGMLIEIENLRTSEVLNIITNGGEFVKDLTDFEIYTQSTDDYEIRYCVSDSRCDQETLMFAITGSRRDLSRDITYVPGGLSGPYPVYGRVTQDGSAIQNGDIILENLNKGYLLNLVTTDLGEYSYNIANWGSYDIGDVIRLTYESYQASFTILSFDTPGHELNLEITTSNPPTPPTDPDNEDDDWIEEDGFDDTIEDEDPEEDPIIKPEPTPEPTPNPTPEPNPEPIKGGLWLLMLIIILIVIGGGYVLYKKYKG